MRDYQKEFHKRVEFIKEVLKKSGASGIVFGNNGGKDSALVGILCKDFLIIRREEQTFEMFCTLFLYSAIIKLMQ